MAADAVVQRPAGASPPAPTRREFGIIAFATVAVLLLLRCGRPPFFRAHFRELVADWPWPDLWSYVYMSGASVVIRMLLPLAFMVWVLRESPRDFGYRLNGTGGLGRIYLVLLAFMVPLLWWAASMASFQDKYPLFHDAGETWTLLLIYEASYFFIFLSGESFWRGFLVFGLARRFGWYALPMSMIPYVIVHLGKPIPETFGAIVTGYVLGYLALRHGSYWLGVALHFTIAVLMDLFALIRSGSLPTHW